jgi:hypothetical protein
MYSLLKNISFTRQLPDQVPEFELQKQGEDLRRGQAGGGDKVINGTG